MILKSFELNKIKLDNYKFYLFYGDNEGLKEENIKNLFEKNYQDKNEKDFILKISSTSEKVILSKNTAGDATSFKNSISINVEVLMNNKFKSNFIILESFNYNNISNKFDLKQLEKDIKNNLAELASDKLIFKLSNIQ